jgi:hypothetical protein
MPWVYKNIHIPPGFHDELVKIKESLVHMNCPTPLTALGYRKLSTIHKREGFRV